MHEKTANQHDLNEEVLQLRRQIIEIKDELIRERRLRLDSEERADLAAALVEQAEAVAKENREQLAFTQQCEQRFNRLLQNSNDIIAVIDKDGRTLSISGPCERILGYKPEDLTGMIGFRHIHPDDLASTQKIFFDLVKTPGAVRSAEFRYRQNNGNWVTLEAVGANLLEDPIVQGVVLNSRNISMRKKLEAQLQQATKMEAIGVLAGGVAHDFNNLLNVINGYSELLLADLPKNDPKHEDLKEIHQAGKRAASLTSQLLAFSRKQMLQPVIMNLNEVIAGMRLMFPRLIGEDTELQIVTPPDLNLIYADPGQIQQIILNLILNARDAMPHGGKLTIETANAEYDESDIQSNPALQPGPYARLSISDSGAGMNAATLSHLFEPFYTTKPKGNGTGLGLSTVYGIVNQSNGAIWACSEPGKGTTFNICFPRAEGKAARLVYENTPAVQHGGSETVLVAEDESAVRALTVRVLRGRGYTVLDAANGTDALKVAGEHAGIIHLVLTDVMMPGMNGRELAHHLKTVRPRIKSLFVSGYAANAIAHHGVLDSNVAFLPKPFSADDLARRVREILDS